ncbi:MAG: hypothetical protein ACR2MO_00680, partial [Acidimicrobiales bacterium]
APAASATPPPPAPGTPPVAPAVRPGRVAESPERATTTRHTGGSPSPWLVPMILVGVALAGASSAIVAKDARNRRAQPAKAEANPPA